MVKETVQRSAAALHNITQANNLCAKFDPFKMQFDSICNSFSEWNPVDLLDFEYEHLNQILHLSKSINAFVLVWYFICLGQENEVSTGKEVHTGAILDW